jgi:hypothetical protein
MSQIACTLNSGQMEKRRRRWDALVDRAFVSRTETPNGLQLVFREDEAIEAELRQLAELERECCAFADWTVDGAVLKVTGTGDEGVAAVHGMFRPFG